MGVYGGIQLPNINEDSMDDKKERKQILNYLAMLDEKLRYMFQNIDIEDNFSEDGKREYQQNIYQLNLEMKNMGEDIVNVRADVDGNYTEFVQTADGIRTTVGRLNYEVSDCYSKIEQTNNKISMMVAAGSDSSEIILMPSMIRAVSENIDLVGLIHVYQTGYGGNLGGRIGYTTGNDGVNSETVGIAMADYTGENYFIATSSGARMTASGTALSVMDERISANVEISQPSDLNLKNSVDYRMEKFEKLFENLKPCSYKYNKQAGNGNHIGFIVQEVEEAANDAGIKTEEFSAIVKQDDFYGLGYSNFIALNTHMIQKLMTRVEELENKLEALS